MYINPSNSYFLITFNNLFSSFLYNTLSLTTYLISFSMFLYILLYSSSSILFHSLFYIPNILIFLFQESFDPFIYLFPTLVIVFNSNSFIFFSIFINILMFLKRLHHIHIFL